MLWNASAITGYTIDAADGQIGAVSDMLFDETDWHIRWVVVDTGTWLPGRKVLLPLSALGTPNLDDHAFPIKLTMQQVKDSPDIDADLPVSRQVEAQIHEYFAFNPYWAGISPAMLDASILPIASPLDPALVSAIGTDENAPPPSGDPHLFSVNATNGCHIHATDGEIGHVEDMLIDDSGWRVRYLKVATRNWWPGERVLISPSSVQNIEWAGRMVNIGVSREQVKNAPAYNPAITVDDAYNEEYLTYYGIKWTKG